MYHRASCLCRAAAQSSSPPAREPAAAPQADPAPCVAAVAANDDDKIIAVCGALIDNEKTVKADRIKALIARAGAYGAQGPDRPRHRRLRHRAAARSTLADIFNARGELWRRKGDRPKALADFGAAIKLNPNHPAAQAPTTSRWRRNWSGSARRSRSTTNRVSIAPPRGRAVEKAICANPELANLDRQINAVNSRVVSEAARADPRVGRALQREQGDFIAKRNASFGRPDYDLQKAMHERLDHLLALGH